MNNNRASTYIQRSKAMKRVGYISYDQFLKSELWKQIKSDQRNKYKNGDKCCFCGSTDNVNLHHKAYGFTNFKTARMKNIIPACGHCHYNIHCLEKEFDLDTERATIVYNIIYFPEVPQFTWEMQKSAPDKRLLSLEIVKDSNLPATLHHSIHGYLGVWGKVKPEQFVEKYRVYKTAKKDQIMLDLLSKYEDQLISYLKTLSTT